MCPKCPNLMCWGPPLCLCISEQIFGLKMVRFVQRTDYERCNKIWYSLKPTEDNRARKLLQKDPNDQLPETVKKTALKYFVSTLFTIWCAMSLFCSCSYCNCELAYCICVPERNTFIPFRRSTLFTVSKYTNFTLLIY